MDQFSFRITLMFKKYILRALTLLKLPNVGQSKRHLLLSTLHQKEMAFTSTGSTVGTASVQIYTSQRLLRFADTCATDLLHTICTTQLLQKFPLHFCQNHQRLQNVLIPDCIYGLQPYNESLEALEKYQVRCSEVGNQPTFSKP